MKKDTDIPNKVEPGYAVICDPNGNGARVVEAYMVCEPSRGAELRPIEGRRRGTVIPGALLDKVKSGQLIVTMWSPYPQMRGDNLPHVNGALGYPGPGDAYANVDGCYYHNVHGAKYLQALQAEKAAAAKPAPEVKKGA